MPEKAKITLPTLARTPMLAHQIERVAGDAHDDVPHYQPYGLYSLPKSGCECLVLDLASRSQSVVLIADDTARDVAQLQALGLQAGEVAVYTSGGASIVLKTSGAVVINAPTAGVVINGNLSVTGNVSDASGSLSEMRSTYNSHVHGSSPTPTPQMS